VKTIKKKGGYKMMKLRNCLIGVLSIICSLWLVGNSYAWYEDEQAAVLTDDQVAYLTSYIHNLSWSPDGRKIAFSGFLSVFGQPADIYVVNVDTKEIVNLTNTPDIDEAGPIAWSPDGGEIAYVVIEQVERSRQQIFDIPHIWIMNSDGTNRRLLLNRPCDNPVWSPDGEFLLVSAEIGGPWGTSWEPVLVRKNGEEIRLMGFSGYPLSWSPDGRYILFYSDEEKENESIAYGVLYRYDLQTNQIAKLTTEDEDVMAGEFFRNIPKLWYYDQHIENVVFMDIDGSNKVVAPDLPDEFFITFGIGQKVPSPDGSKIACVASSSTPPIYVPPYNIYIMNSDGTGVEQITFFTGIQEKGQAVGVGAYAGNIFNHLRYYKVIAKNVGNLSKDMPGNALHREGIHKSEKDSQMFEKSNKQTSKIAIKPPLADNKEKRQPSRAPALPIAASITLPALSYALWKLLRILA
jgi:hypothetical protein